MRNITKNFTIQEFYCNDGTPIPYNMLDSIKELATNLQVLRDYLGSPISINSAYRNPTYNEKVRGRSGSKHMECIAADIVVSGYSPKEVADTIEQLIKEGKMKQGGLGRYATFTHYDIRGTAARWGQN